MSADPEKIARAVAEAEADIAKREFMVSELDNLRQEQENWIVFLTNTRIPALKAMLEPDVSGSTSHEPINLINQEGTTND